MTVETIYAKGWSDISEKLFENSWNEGLQRHRSNYAFRGVKNASFSLTPSLYRLGNKDHIEKVENALFRSFKKYAYDYRMDNYSLWYYLSLAQHHGLATRLLDWTTSPLTALHFATEEPYDYQHDIAIWCVNLDDIKALLPYRWGKLLNSDHDSARVFTIDMLDELVQKIDDFDTILKDYGNFLAFFEPPSLDGRIINQFGFFSVMPDATTVLDKWLDKDENGQHRKIIIPKQYVWEIRNKLDQSNINERVLFPGLDGLSKWLNRYYSPAPSKGKKARTNKSIICKSIAIMKEKKIKQNLSK